MKVLDYETKIPEIQKLFRQVFQRDISRDYLHWRFSENVFNLPQVKLLEENGQLIGHYASTPVEVKIKNKIYKAGVVGSVMTHPDYQGRGVFQKLSSDHEIYLRELGYDFVFTFPMLHRSSGPIFINKLGWLPIAEILTLQLLISKPKNDNIHLTFDNDFSKIDYSKLSDRDGLVTNLRTTKLLKWRYTNHPINKYQNIILKKDNVPLGYAVCKIFENDSKRFVDIVDFCIFEIGAMKQVLRNILQFANNNNCVGINLWSPPHHWTHHYWIAAGFTEIQPITYLTVKCFNPEIKNEIESYSNWWITMGDSDVY